MALATGAGTIGGDVGRRFFSRPDPWLSSSIKLARAGDESRSRGRRRRRRFIMKTATTPAIAATPMMPTEIPMALPSGDESLDFSPEVALSDVPVG